MENDGKCRRLGASARDVTRIVFAAWWFAWTTSAAEAAYTADGRKCMASFDIGDGVTKVSECVPFKESGALWCRAEDGAWGVCAELQREDAAGAEEVRNAALALADTKSSASAKSAAMKTLSRASTLSLRLFADQPIEIDGVEVENPIIKYLEMERRYNSAAAPKPSPPPVKSPTRSPPPSPSPSPSPPLILPTPAPASPPSRCAVRSNVRWESPQADGSYEYGMDVYAVLTSGASITSGWEIVFKFSSDDVTLYTNSAYGASVSIAYDPYGVRVFKLRDRGYDATMPLYSTRRVGFNTRARSRRALELSFVQINGERCDIVPSNDVARR